MNDLLIIFCHEVIIIIIFPKGSSVFHYHKFLATVDPQNKTRSDQWPKLQPIDAETTGYNFYHIGEINHGNSYL